MGRSEPRDLARGWRGDRSGKFENSPSFVGGGMERIFPVHTPSNYLRAVMTCPFGGTYLCTMLFLSCNTDRGYA